MTWPQVWSATDSVALFQTLERLSWTVHTPDRDPVVVLHDVVEAVVDSTPYEVCWVGVWSGDLPTPTPLHAYAGFKLGYSGERFVEWPISESPSGGATTSGQPVIIQDVNLDDRFPHLRADGELRGYRSVLVIPFPVGEEAGCLWLAYNSPHDFDELEIAFATVLTSIVAIALRNAYEAHRERARFEQQCCQLRELERLHEIIATQNSRLSRLNEVYRELAAIVLAEQGMAALAGELGSQLGCDIRVVDRSGDVVGASETSAAIVGEDELHRIATQVQAEASPGRPITGQGDGFAFLGASIVNERGHFGAVVAVRVAPPFADDEAALVEQASWMIALEQLKQRIRLEADIRVNRDFARSLADPNISDSVLRQQAGLLGLDLARPRLCLHLRVHEVPGDGAFRDEAAAVTLIRTRVSRDFPDTVVVATGNRDLAIIVTPQLRRPRSISDLCETVRSSVRTAIDLFADDKWRTGKVSIGVGDAEAGPSGLRRSLADATQALLVLESLGRQGGNLSLREAGSLAVLAGGDADHHDFVDRYLHRVLENDSLHATELLDTLAAYFAACGSVQKAADAMFVHVTTVRYRLGRVEALTGMSLRDAEDRLCLEMAVRLHAITPSENKPV